MNTMPFALTVAAAQSRSLIESALPDAALVPEPPREPGPGTWRRAVADALRRAGDRLAPGYAPSHQALSH